MNPLGLQEKPVFSEPELQAQYEQNLAWLRLMREDPGWVLSRLMRLQELERDREREEQAARGRGIDEANARQRQRESIRSAEPTADR